MKHSTVRTIKTFTHRNIEIQLNQAVQETWNTKLGQMTESKDVGKPYYITGSRFKGFTKKFTSLEEITDAIDWNLSNASDFRLWGKISQSKENYLKELTNYGVHLKLEDLRF